MKLINWLMAALGLVVLLAAPVAQAQNPLLSEICAHPANQRSTLCQEYFAAREANQAANRLFGPDGIVTRIVNLLSFIIGVAAVIVIIIGGLKYITSSGDPSNVTTARNTIIYALVGVVIAAFGQLVVLFVLDRM